MVNWRIEPKEAVAVVEAAHAGQETLQSWLDDLVEATRRFVPNAPLVVAAIVQRHVDHWTLVAADTKAHAIGPLASFGEMLPHVPAAALDAYYRVPEHVDTHSRIRNRLPAAREVGDLFLQNLGVEDSVAMISQGGDGISMVLFSMTPFAIELGWQERLLLTRAAAHIETMLRVRIDHAGPVAILGPDGRVLDAEGTGKTPSAREMLTEHVKSVEKRRLRVERKRSHAIDGWSALVSGRFGLVERSDGERREYHVYENPPHVWGARALTTREASILELSARGLSGKLVAYTLGLSFGSVSHALASAAKKTGCGSRTELVRLAATVLRPDGLTLPLDALTEAERQVLDRLRDGWSNAAIAQARGTSERTVANQVGSLLRKSGLVSRRALAASTLDEASTSSPSSK